MPGPQWRDGVLGVDVGGTKVALRAEAGGRPAYDRIFRWPRGADPAADLAALAAEVDRLRDEWGPVGAVGVAMPATTDPAGTVTTWPGRPGWAGLDFAGALRRIFPDAVTAVADDGDLAALAEARHAGRDDVVYLGVGTGIGGGVVLAGRSVPGRSSAEVGHMVVALDGEPCDCGRRGCLQSIASGPATLRRAGAGRGAEVSFDDLRAGLDGGLPWAVAAVDASCRALAAAVVSLGELLDPTLVVVGGGFAAGLPGFVPLVAERARSAGRPGRPAPPVRAAALGALSSLHGAVELARSLTEAPSTVHPIPTP
ncbi:ROK family protein [Micromonospora peucetia]|uniref:Kanosamine 6-kinase n=1 Tax=Micromonospora peucetia TaxID=47871 RepID=A0A1C6W4J4_9ACTN|nr:ROK family protein [Micromonospora peucetia]MCX4390223.1 ROK family protein [Micromonospora peucetia]WSA32468.1 ROK family protein [Micromonospora peucetia]SCL73334.1 kanosamine 6-kinase [Micromonospora peucetia]